MRGERKDGLGARNASPHWSSRNRYSGKGNIRRNGCLSAGKKSLVLPSILGTGFPRRKLIFLFVIAALPIAECKSDPESHEPNRRNQQHDYRLAQRALAVFACALRA